MHPWHSLTLKISFFFTNKQGLPKILNVPAVYSKGGVGLGAIPGGGTWPYHSISLLLQPRSVCSRSYCNLSLTRLGYRPRPHYSQGGEVGLSLSVTITGSLTPRQLMKLISVLYSSLHSLCFSLCLFQLVAGLWLEEAARPALVSPVRLLQGFQRGVFLQS